jgi:hypothetical protein
MTTISPNLLNDTLNLVALARETALSRGDQAKAQRLAPVVENLRGVAAEAQKTKSATAGGELLTQGDFQTMLAALLKQPVGGSPTPNPTERNQIITAMSAGGMSHVDIARQMGIGTEEVRMTLSLGQMDKSQTTFPAKAQNTGAALSPDGDIPQAARTVLNRRIAETYGR